MTGRDLIALLPLLVLAGTALAVMLVIAIRRSHPAAASCTLLGFALACAALPLAASVEPRSVPPLLVLDPFADFFMGLLFATGFAVAVLAYGYLQRGGGNPEEFYILLLLATLGSAVLVASRHFASLFLGLEILSVALYVLIGYLRASPRSLEAGLKYLILAAASSAFLLFGMALVYARLGTMDLIRLATALNSTPTGDLVVLAGLGLMLTGVGFKLAVVPFHMWTPDVYQGAAVPVTAFVATASKGAVLALLLRVGVQAGLRDHGLPLAVLALIAVVSMFAGNLLALLQENVKRVLAYSSIAHLGYLLVPFVAGGPLAVEALTYYLVAYVVTTVGAFGVVTVLSDPDRDAEPLDEYAGLLWRRPWLGVLFAASLLSLAGIPLTAGFVGKFYLFSAALGSRLWLLALAVAVNSAIGIFYYLRIVAVMFTSPRGTEPARAAVPPVPMGGGLVLAALGILLLWLGVHPSPLLRLIQATVGSLV